MLKGLVNKDLMHKTPTASLQSAFRLSRKLFRKLHAIKITLLIHGLNARRAVVLLL